MLTDKLTRYTANVEHGEVHHEPDTKGMCVLFDDLAQPAASGEPVATHMQMMDHLESLKTDPATLARLRAAVTPHPAPARVPLTDAQIKRAVEAGWLAALECHAKAGMAGWSAERETYIANAIKAARGITAPD